MVWFDLVWSGFTEHHELQQKFDKKERECDAKTQEKEDMMQTLNKMKEKLEKESSEHKQVKQQVADLSAQLHDLNTVRLFACLAHNRANLPRFHEKYNSIRNCIVILHYTITSLHPPPPFSFSNQE